MAFIDARKAIRRETATLDTTELEDFADVEDEDELEENELVLLKYFLYTVTLCLYIAIESQWFVHVRTCYSNSSRG